MVFIELPGREVGMQLAETLAGKGVKIMGGQVIRLVTHLDVSEQDIDRVAELIQGFFRNWN